MCVREIERDYTTVPLGLIFLFSLHGGRNGEREREKGKERKKGKEREKGKECVRERERKKIAQDIYVHLFIINNLVNIYNIFTLR